MRFKNKIAGISILLGGMMVAGIGELKAQDVQENTMKFGRLLRLVDSYYVDSTKIGDLTEKAIVEVLRNLDPHSVYISKEEVEKMNEPLQGNFEGVGISFNVFRDTLMVVTTIPGGPSEKVGLRAGDRIVQVDAKKIAAIGLKNTDVYDLLRGKKGTKVDLKIKRKGELNILDFTVIRDKIPINSLDASYMLNENTGYIKLNKFSATTTSEFYDAIKALKSNSKLNSLVLDLRGNGGGYLTAAIELADQFLTAYKLVVYTSGLHAEKKEYSATPLGELEQGKLVVLIDEGSASASEIVSGAIQDWDRGVLIGRRSYGKGLVQQPFPLTDGSMIRLTTAHYYTPSGRCIQKPYTDGVEAYQKDYMHRIENGELFSKDSVVQNKAEKFLTKTTKRTVYGGGGIMPDLFIPLDTSKYYVYYNTLNRKNVVYSGVLDIMDANRDAFKQKYTDFKTFNDKFEVTDEMVDKIIAAGDKIDADKITDDVDGTPVEAKPEKNQKEVKKESPKPDQKSIDFARPLLKKQMKGLIARDLFSISEYFQIMNGDDEAIKKAVEVINKRGEYEKILSGK
ncbi:carboxy-terminal processing protease [Aquipluma nitroreducens]|uniref:Carboxy-terminal processing protease n=1 Tax=Aquipluma nitroreducens TaxID=2010828 RepID=A0A5K7SDV9_9BACT|nr:S41 family peptidase [Aquipluma nitroreducens]BBE19758.1 carboxy-terminal processing protease [Aquipluma nitroreducens]